MTTTTLPTLPELNRKAFAILCREMGVPATLRLFSQMGIGQGNYTEERRALFADLTLDEFEQGIATLKEQQGDHRMD
ncbi:MAG: hypothetical protein QM703_25730 [Gemmatales bacterium]